MEQQRTLDGGLVPTAKLPTDDVVCVEGHTCKRCEAFADCTGAYHHSLDDQRDANVEAVTDLLNNVEKWVCEYTSDGDYPDAYFCIVDEGHHRWNELVEGWLRDVDITGLSCLADSYEEGELDDDFDLEDFNSQFDKDQIYPFTVDDFLKEFYDCPDDDDVAKWIAKELDASFDCDPVYNSNEWAGYEGDGLCLDSFTIGEYEEQIDVYANPVLKDLHDKGELDDVLDCVNCDLYISRSKLRVKNEKTGHYEYVGRETYDNGGDYPTLLGYCSPPGQWHFVVDNDRMVELTKEAIVALTTFNADKVARFIKSECEG